MQKVFVYGTLLSTGSNPAESYAGARVLDTGTVLGRLYDLGWYPGFRPEYIADASAQPTVFGELIEVPDDKLIKLDDYEGYPYLYDRQRVWVTTSNGDLESAWVYTFNNQDALSESNVVPSGDWRNREGVEA